MNNEQKNKNSAAKIKANNKWIQTNYKRMQISTTPEQADYIRETAKKYNITIVQLIIDSIKLFEENVERLPAGAATPSGTADPMQPENVTTGSPMKLRETAGTQPEQEEEETEMQEENETENEIEEEENQTAGAEEPQEDEDEDEKPEDIPSFVWEQIQRLKKADKRHTAERKAREAAERKRRRAEEAEEDIYSMR